MAEVHLTRDGIKALEEKLEYLKNVRRTEIAELISVARSFGDLSENAEYDAAKLEQAKNEYEIAEVEAMLRNAIVIDEEAIDASTVEVGVAVKVRNKTLDFETEYSIVGIAEVDPFQNRISNDSPVGRGLIGHKVGDTVDVETPGGVVAFEILSIRKQ